MIYRLWRFATNLVNLAMMELHFLSTCLLIIKLFPTGLTKAVRIVFTAVFQGSAQGSRMTFSILASYLKIACTSLQGKELYNLSTGVILNDSINSDDCKQLEFAMDAVELSQPSCQTNPSDATTTTTEAGSSTTTTSSLTILFGATLTLLLISGLE
eukprot:m.90469 g.90469  ORF g.90469 m.90469 type:complete len:156 (+) comp13268_c0_seq2:42-509(+)